jgi:hypothetical protein
VTDALWRAIVLPARLRALAHSELLRPFGERDGRKLNSAAAVVVQGKDLSVGLTDERRAELESKRVRLAAHALEAQRAMLVSGLGSAAAAVEPAELSADERHELRADESKWRYYCCGAAGEGLCDPRAEDMKGAEQCADCRSLQSIVALHQYRPPARPRRCRPGFFAAAVRAVARSRAGLPRLRRRGSAHLRPFLSFCRALSRSLRSCRWVPQVLPRADPLVHQPQPAPEGVHQPGGVRSRHRAADGPINGPINSTAHEPDGFRSDPIHRRREDHSLNQTKTKPHG